MKEILKTEDGRTIENDTVKSGKPVYEPHKYNCLMRDKHMGKLIRDTKIPKCTISKKFYRELVYNKTGDCMYERLVDWKTGRTLHSEGSITQEPIGYRVRVTCPNNDTKLSYQVNYSKWWSSEEYYMDLFKIDKVTENLYFDDFYVYDYYGKVCKVLCVRKEYGKQYSRG